MKAMKILTAVALVGMVFTSCKKQSTSTSTLGVTVKATNSTYAVLKSASATTPTFTWDTCYIVVSEFEFQAERRESEQSQDTMNVDYSWKGPKKVDLLNISAAIGNINLQPGVFEQIELEIQAQKSMAGTSPVFYLSGSYTDSTNVKIPVVVIVNEDLTFKVEQSGAMLNGANNYAALINVNLATLMGSITQADLSSATVTNGRIEISSTSNAGLYAKIKMSWDMCEEVQYNQD